jgi:hypothetical protein
MMKIYKVWLSGDIEGANTPLLIEAETRTKAKLRYLKLWSRGMETKRDSGFKHLRCILQRDLDPEVVRTMENYGGKVI